MSKWVSAALAGIAVGATVSLVLPSTADAATVHAPAVSSIIKPADDVLNTCNLSAGVVFQKRFLSSTVICDEPVDKIVIEAWGEDKKGNTTWGPVGNTCVDTNMCEFDPAAAETDYKVTFCGSTEWLGEIKGDCIDVNGPFK